MNEKAWVNNEEGSVLILSLIMLVLLTLIGISATTTSMIETRIAGNERVYKRNLYAAEAAAMHCAQDMEQISNPETNNPGWLHLIGTVDNADIRNDAFWLNESPYPSAPPDYSEVSVLANSRFLATSQGLAGGGEGTSLDMTKGKVHAYSIYGRCRPANSGPTIIEIGYRKGF